MVSREDIRTQVASLTPSEREHLMARLRAARANERDRDAIRPLPPGTRAPLSFAQKRMWFLHQWMPGRPVYHVSVVLRMDGVVDAPALAAALTAVVARHEVLRTRFATDDEGKYQLVDPPPESVKMPVTDLTAQDRERAALVPRMTIARRPTDD